MPQAELTTLELNDLSSIAEQIPLDVKTEFINKYTNWKKTWSKPEIALQSDPRKYAESQEYFDLLSYCKKIDKVSWPLVIEQLSEGDFFASILLLDLTLSDNKSLLEEAKLTGATMAKSTGTKLPSPYTNTINYAKRLIQKEKLNILSAARSVSMLDISNEANVQTNGSNILINVNLTQETIVNIQIFDTYGVLVLAEKRSCNAGSQIINLVAENLKDGIYLAKVTIGDQTVTNKINLKK